jgi:hypothetical protein
VTHRNVAAQNPEQSVKKLMIAVLVAGAVPAFAGERPPPSERNHVKVAVERADQRQREAEAKVIEAKIVEHTKVNQH